MKKISLVLCTLMLISMLPHLSVSAATNKYSAYGADYTSRPLLASKLNDVFNGNIDLYTDYKCKNEISAPLKNKSTVKPGATRYIKVNSKGSVISGESCFIYANAVYNYLFNDAPRYGGSGYVSNSKVVIGKTNLNISGTALYQKFDSAKVMCGAYIRTGTNGNAGSGHSMLVLSYNNKYISILEGNADGNGLIRIRQMTWNEFVSFLSKGNTRYIRTVMQPTGEYYNCLYPCEHRFACTVNSSIPCCVVLRAVRAWFVKHPLLR